MHRYLYLAGNRYTFADCHREQPDYLCRIYSNVNGQWRHKLYMEHRFDCVKHYSYAGCDDGLHRNRHNKRLQFR